MRVAILCLLLSASTAYGACIGQPSRTLRGWKSMSAWTLPGDLFAVSYVCSGDARKIVVERFMSRMAPEAHYVSDVTMPKLQRGELLIEGGECSRNGQLDPYIVPFGRYTNKGVARVQHAWRVEVPSGRITPIDVKNVRCEASNERF